MEDTENVTSTMSKKPDWLSMQYNSFFRYFERHQGFKSAPRISFDALTRRHFPIALQGGWQVRLDNWELTEAKEAYECLRNDETHCGTLSFKLSLLDRGIRLGNPYRRKVARIPVPTPSGEFILESQTPKTP